MCSSDLFPSHDRAPAFGFAMGVERLMLLLSENYFNEKNKVFFVWLGEETKIEAFKLTQKLRNLGIEVGIEYESKSMKAQMKRADKFGAKKVLILGENELNEGKIILKDFTKGEQEEILLSEVENKLI